MLGGMAFTTNYVFGDDTLDVVSSTCPAANQSQQCDCASPHIGESMVAIREAERYDSLAICNTLNAWERSISSSISTWSWFAPLIVGCCIQWACEVSEGCSYGGRRKEGYVTRETLRCILHYLSELPQSVLINIVSDMHQRGVQQNRNLDAGGSFPFCSLFNRTACRDHSYVPAIKFPIDNGSTELIKTSSAIISVVVSELRKVYFCHFFHPFYSGLNAL